MLEIETLSWQIISLINMYCSSSSLWVYFVWRASYSFYILMDILTEQQSHIGYFFPVGLQSQLSVSHTVDCLLPHQLLYRIFFSRSWWLNTCNPRNWKVEGSRRSLAWGKSAAQNETLFQIQETLFPHIGPRSHQDICYANSTVHPSELKCKVVLY